VAINEKALGPDHPGIVSSLSVLAVVHYKQGQYAEARRVVPTTLTALAVITPETVIRWQRAGFRA
jgi:hypothetical protein